MNRAAAFLAFSLIACGSSPPPPAARVDVPVASDSTSATPIVKARPGQGASEALRKRWPLTQPQLAVYANVSGFAKTELVAGFVPTLLTIVKPFVDEAQSQCARDLIAGSREIAFGTDADDHWIMLLRFAPDNAEWPKNCIAIWPKATPIDATSWSLASDEVVAVDSGMIVAGTTSLVAEARAARGNKGGVLDDLRLAPDQYATWTFDDANEKLVAHGALTASGDRFRFEVDATLPNEALAKQIESQVQRLRGEAGQIGKEKPEDAAAIDRLVRAVSFERTGKHVDAAFDLHESPTEQSKDLGTLAATGVYAVRTYIKASKAAEARNTVGQIAKDLVVWYERDDIAGTPRAKRKLFSLPPVPKTVPRAVKFQTSPADWKAWEKIRFSMDQPQYYQYEVRAGKDGKSAEVIARGDLDGNGKTSLFSVSVKIDGVGGPMSVSPSIHEESPEE